MSSSFVLSTMLAKKRMVDMTPCSLILKLRLLFKTIFIPASPQTPLIGKTRAKKA